MTETCRIDANGRLVRTTRQTLADGRSPESVVLEIGFERLVTSCLHDPATDQYVFETVDRELGGKTPDEDWQWNRSS